MPAGPSDPPLPPRENAQFGAWRVRTLDAAISGRPLSGPVPLAVNHELAVWAEEIIASAHGPTRGLLDRNVPNRWRDTLAWAGMPFGVAGDVRWGEDLHEQSSLAVPELRDGQLLLPLPEVLEQLTSLALRPVRLFIAEKLGTRLQVAAGVHFYLWANQAALVSCCEVPVGGFLYGPEAGQRHSLSLPPGGGQVISW